MQAIFHSAFKMDLTFGAGRYKQITARVSNVLEMLYLKGLAERVTSGPSTISATDGAGFPVLHFYEFSGFYSPYQFPWQISPVFKSAQSTWILKGETLIKGFESHRTLIDFLFQKFI